MGCSLSLTCYVCLPCWQYGGGAYIHGGTVFLISCDIYSNTAPVRECSPSELSCIAHLQSSSKLTHLVISRFSYASCAQRADGRCTPHFKTHRSCAPAFRNLLSLILLLHVSQGPNLYLGSGSPSVCAVTTSITGVAPAFYIQATRFWTSPHAPALTLGIRPPALLYGGMRAGPSPLFLSARASSLRSQGRPHAAPPCEQCKWCVCLLLWSSACLRV